MGRRWSYAWLPPHLSGTMPETGKRPRQKGNPRTGTRTAGKREREAFRRSVWTFFRERGRTFPWRETRDPFAILVSEYMLQQTQVGRVEEMFPGFMARFPDAATLARAPLRDVLAAWQGLGYNRRAVALHRAAALLVGRYGGRIPADRDALLSLPGVGPSTAAGVMAFAFNRPVVLLETNIRRVFLHHFFPGRNLVPDREILPLVEATLDRDHPREWYWALMDLGSELRRLPDNPNRRSPAYRPQSPFDGSDRQIRGQILRILLREGILDQGEAAAATGCTPARVERILAEMEREGFLERIPNGRIRICDGAGSQQGHPVRRSRGGIS
ncbi:MAG: A/G-specific adenine glycosylase [Methanomicrobiales archaeon]|nr:A/G-specific adenine glycosylase [Methanomicrobiales archaeon]